MEEGGEKRMDRKAKDFRLLEEENQKLKQEKELLLKTVEQMNVTINRLLNHYVTGKEDH